MTASTSEQAVLGLLRRKIDDFWKTPVKRDAVPSGPQSVIDPCKITDLQGFCFFLVNFFQPQLRFRPFDGFWRYISKAHLIRNMDLNISGDFKSKGSKVNFNLPVITFHEDGVFFFYTPALDLTGYGKTEEEAESSFEETLGQFLDYGTNKSTLFSELKKLGWKVSKKSVSKPPSLIDMINNNEYLAEIFEEKQYKKFHQTINLPAFV